MLQRVDFTGTEAHIDQHLRALAQGLTGLSKGLPATLEGHQHLQRSDNRIPRGGVIETHHMPGVLAANDPFAL
ncbi:hypothetical protein D3C80_1908720 [compost metagenome]